MLITVITKMQDKGGAWVPVARRTAEIHTEADVTRLRGPGYPSSKCYFDTRGETSDRIAIVYKDGEA